MPRLPRIAVVTPSFNTGRHIGDAVRSVLEQDYRDFDYIVMDGGSTDGTLDVLRSFGSELRWVSAKDDGQGDAVHRGFAQTTGEILGWLNSDDTYAPHAFRAVAEFFAAHPDVALVYGDANFVDADGRLIGPCAHIEPYSAKRLFCYSDIIVQPAAFFRREAYEAVGGIDTSLHYAMDYDLWLKIAKRFKVAYLPRRLADFRWLLDNKTATGGLRRIDEITALVRRQGFDEPAYIRLERVNFKLRQSLGAIRRGDILRSFSSVGSAAWTALSCRRLLWSLLQPQTWRVIYMGQVLRVRAARAQQRRAKLPALATGAESL